MMKMKQRIRLIMKHKEREIEELIDKFMAGETSTDEEARLSKFFRENEVKDEWKAYKEMFRMFDCGMTEVAEPDRKRGKARTFILWATTAAAACIAIVLLLPKDTSLPPAPAVTAYIDSIMPESVQPKAEEEPRDTMPQKQEKLPSIRQYQMTIDRPLYAKAETMPEETENLTAETEVLTAETEQNTVTEEKNHVPTVEELLERQVMEYLQHIDKIHEDIAGIRDSDE